MNLRTILVLTGTMVLAVMTTAPVFAQVTVPGSCFQAEAGFGNLIEFDTDTCVGTPPSPCTVETTAVIAGLKSDSGRDVSAEGRCGGATASSSAEVPGILSPFDFVDEDHDGPVGPGSPMVGCDIDGAGGRTLWFGKCEYTFVPE